MALLHGVSKSVSASQVLLAGPEIQTNPVYTEVTSVLTFVSGKSSATGVVID